MESRAAAIGRRKGVVARPASEETRLNLCVETAVNEDLSPEIASPVMMGFFFLTLIYYLSLSLPLSRFISLFLSYSFFRTHLARAYILNFRSFAYPPHSLRHPSRFPRHHLVDSLKSVPPLVNPEALEAYRRESTRRGLASRNISGSVFAVFTFFSFFKLTLTFFFKSIVRLSARSTNFATLLRFSTRGFSTSRNRVVHPSRREGAAVNHLSSNVRIGRRVALVIN